MMFSLLLCDNRGYGLFRCHIGLSPFGVYFKESHFGFNCACQKYFFPLLVVTIYSLAGFELSYTTGKWGKLLASTSC